jgi:hypothetical protein
MIEQRHVPEWRFGGSLKAEKEQVETSYVYSLAIHSSLRTETGKPEAAELPKLEWYCKMGKAVHCIRLQATTKWTMSRVERDEFVAQAQAEGKPRACWMRFIRCDLIERALSLSGHSGPPKHTITYLARSVCTSGSAGEISHTHLCIFLL